MLNSSGINFFGSSDTADGIGRAAALNLESIKNTHFNTQEFVLSRPVALERKSNLIITDDLLNSLKYKINCFQFSARWIPHYFAHLSPQILDGYYNIGYWFCEVSDLPDQWARQLHFFDEIWTASSFCQDSISKVSIIPVTKIPLFIESRAITKRIEGRLLGNKYETFRFCTVANMYSDAERKNILFSIKCFLDVYEHDLSTEFVVKVSNLEYDDKLSAILSKIAKTHSNVIVISEFVPQNEIEDLYNTIDVYVSLHRAEGFGLTISDAIARGIPTITTGYSGNMDFCNHDQVMLVDYKLVEVGHDRLRYKKNDLWAEPDMGSAIKWFKVAKSDYSNHLLRAKEARLFVRENFSNNVVSNIIENRLELINNGFEFSNDFDSRDIEIDIGIKNTYGF